MTEERAAAGDARGAESPASARDRRQHASLDAAPELFEPPAEPDAGC